MEQPGDIDSGAIIARFKAAEDDYRASVQNLLAEIERQKKRSRQLAVWSVEEWIVSACLELARALFDIVVESALRTGRKPSADELIPYVTRRVLDVSVNDLQWALIDSDQLQIQIRLRLKPQTGLDDALISLVSLATGGGGPFTGNMTQGPEAATLEKGIVSAVDARSSSRKAIVEPLLNSRRFLPGTWATKAGVPTSTVYDYLNGKTKRLNYDSRTCMAVALGIKEEELPE
jgi:hypothetical protein